MVSKKSLVELTKLTAIELAPKIRVNAIAPGWILSSEHVKEDSTKLKKKVPLNAKGDISDISSAVQYLVSSNYVTGQTLFVDGGMSL